MKYLTVVLIIPLCVILYFNLKNYYRHWVILPQVMINNSHNVPTVLYWDKNSVTKIHQTEFIITYKLSYLSLNPNREKMYFLGNLNINCKDGTMDSESVRLYIYNIPFVSINQSIDVNNKNYKFSYLYHKICNTLD